MALLVFSFLFSVLLTPLSVLCAERVGALDLPDGERKRHARPTPRLGGLAIFSSVLFSALLLFPPSSVRDAALSGGALLAVLGVTDDIFSLSAPLKLFAELAVALIPIAFGVYPRVLSFGAYSLSLPPFVGCLFALLWVTLLPNAFNLIDGLDGLCVSLALVSSASLSVLTPLATLPLGASLGFLPYNRPSLRLPEARRMPTRAFLGDTGALLLGYLLAVLSLSEPSFSVFLLLFFAVPLAELFLSSLRRILRGKSPFQADRGHFHHRLVDQGYSPILAVLLLFLYATLFASVGVCLTMLL